jgi:hypothetical protein
MKTYGGMYEYRAPILDLTEVKRDVSRMPHDPVGAQKGIKKILTLALVGGEWSALRPDCFTPRERVSGTHWVGGWVGPKTDLGDV